VSRSPSGPITSSSICLSPARGSRPSARTCRRTTWPLSLPLEDGPPEGGRACLTIGAGPTTSATLPSRRGSTPVCPPRR
jgi:hypothetical protein